MPINEINLIQLINKILIIWYGSLGGQGCSINDIEIISISPSISTSTTSTTSTMKDNGIRKIILKIISSLVVVPSSFLPSSLYLPY